MFGMIVSFNFWNLNSYYYHVFSCTLCSVCSDATTLIKTKTSMIADIVMILFIWDRECVYFRSVDRLEFRRYYHKYSFYSDSNSLILCTHTYYSSVFVLYITVCIRLIHDEMISYDMEYVSMMRYKTMGNKMMWSEKW